MSCLAGKKSWASGLTLFSRTSSTVIDLGVEARGSIGTSMLATGITMGGLGKVTLVPGIIDGFYLQFAQVWVDNPAIACLCSQMPGWKIKTEDFSGMAFGPARPSPGNRRTSSRPWTTSTTPRQRLSCCGRKSSLPLRTWTTSRSNARLTRNVW